MTVADTGKRLRATAARSPLLRKLAGKAALYAPQQAVGGPNASAWVVGEGSLWPIAERYADSFPLPPTSYGTVRDFADSADQITGLAGASFDMKDLQRCWTVKAILGNVERGSRILEIGAGEPLVAGVSRASATTSPWSILTTAAATGRASSNASRPPTRTSASSASSSLRTSHSSPASGRFTRSRYSSMCRSIKSTA